MTSRRYATLAAEDLGVGADPIVLLPGLTFDRRTWRPVVEALQAADPSRRVLVLELPGHGESPAQPPHDLPRVVDLVHDALDAAGVERPLVVGHSMAGAIASLYAARFPTAGAVSIDQLPLIEQFAGFVRSLEPQLRGPEFDRVWREVFAASFHTEVLEPAARTLVESTSRPSRELVMSYWQALLERPPQELQAMVDEALAEIGRRGVPYLLVLGSEPPAPMLAAVRSTLPTVRVEIWAPSGHFPQLARPGQLADLLLGELSGSGPASGKAAPDRQ